MWFVTGIDLRWLLFLWNPVEENVRQAFLLMLSPICASTTLSQRVSITYLTVFFVGVCNSFSLIYFEESVKTVSMFVVSICEHFFRFLLCVFADCHAVIHIPL